jgi:beta-glucosidase-like glycosyl hydrolase
VQKWALERTRPGIPVLMHEEALHGHVAREATSFPQAIGPVSSFDPELVTHRRDLWRRPACVRRDGQARARAMAC